MIRVVDGRRVGFDDSGGSGTPVVLLHGFPLDRSIWDDVLPALAAYRVVRVDLRGCGESDPGDGPALMEGLAADVHDLLDLLGIEKAAIAGHSIGGYVALSYFRLFAERCSGLALVASHADPDAAFVPNPSPEQKALGAAREALARALESEASMEPAIASYLPRYFAPAVYGERPELVERARAVMARQHPRGCAELVRGMAQRLDAWDVLPDIEVPSLVLAGGADYYLTVDGMRATAAAMHAPLEVIESAGHLPQWEAPERTGEILARWLERVGT